MANTVGFFSFFRRLATTKFQPTDTRKALPCFDEPAMKATFSTVIAHDKDYTALSNMPVVKKKTLANGRIESHFKKTVPMSTYLLAFIVCDFKFTNATTGQHNNITVSHSKIDIMIFYIYFFNSYIHWVSDIQANIWFSEFMHGMICESLIMLFFSGP